MSDLTRDCSTSLVTEWRMLLIWWSMAKQADTVWINADTEVADLGGGLDSGRKTDSKWNRWDLMLSTSRRAPDHIRLVYIQLKTGWPHPRCGVTRCGLRHCRPRDASTASQGIVRLAWQRAQLVHVIPRSSYTVRSSRRFRVDPNIRVVRSPAGVGPWTDPFPTLHGRPAAAHHQPRSTPAPVCRRYAGVRFLSTRRHCSAGVACIHVHQRRRDVDAVEPASAQHSEDRGHVVCVFSASEPVTDRAAAARTGRSYSGARRPWPWDLSRFWRLDEDARHEDCRLLLCCPTTDPQHTEVRHEARSAVTCRVAGADAAWLRLRDAGGSAG